VRVCVCVYAYIHVCMHIPANAHIKFFAFGDLGMFLCARVCVCVCIGFGMYVCACMHKYICTCLEFEHHRYIFYTCIHAYIHAYNRYTHTYKYTHTHTYIHTYTSIYDYNMYKHIHTHTHTGTHSPDLSEQPWDSEASLNTTNMMYAESYGKTLALHVGDISYAVGYASKWDDFHNQVCV
jgi:hypothetical protein